MDVSVRRLIPVPLDQWLGRLTIRRLSSLFRLGREGSRAAGMAAGRRARARAHKALVAAGAGARGPAAAPACRRAAPPYLPLTCPLVDRVLPRVGVCPGGPRGGVCTDPAARRPRVREGGGVGGRARGPAGRPACPRVSIPASRLALGRFLAVARGARRGSATGRPYPYE